MDTSGFGNLCEQTPNANLEACLSEKLGELRHIAQIELIACVVLGNEQDPANIRAVVLDSGHQCLNRHGQGRVGQIIKTAGEEVGVYGRELEAGIAQVH